MKEEDEQEEEEEKERVIGEKAKSKLITLRHFTTLRTKHTFTPQKPENNWFLKLVVEIQLETTSGVV